MDYKSGGALVISEENIPFTAYQAIYHKITRRVEVLSRRYREAHHIKYEDIANLHYRLSQILAQYSVRGNRVQITHSVRDGFSTTHSSFEKFSKSSLSHREITSGFDFELDFLIVLPSEIREAENIAQRYKLNITFQRNLDDEDDIFSPYFMDLFRGRSSLFMRLEYSDYAVAQTLDATIESWVKGLPKTEIRPFIRWLMTHEELSQRHIGVVIGAIAPISAAIYIATHEIQFKVGFILSLVSFFLYELTSNIASQVVDNGYSVIRKVAPDIEVILTEGDRDRVSKKEDSRKKIRSYVTFGIITVVVSLAINIFSSWIYETLIST